MPTADEPSSTAATDLLVSAIEDFAHQSAGAKILDFGCGNGGLAGSLLARGFDAFGCDIDNDLWNANTAEAHWQKNALVDPKRLAVIQKNPYRLPYEDNTFDVVLSTSVLEHAQNKEEILLEIHRVLRPGGMTLHVLPSKWYLPSEPHVFVPLLNFFWPYCPKWWLYLWALLGVKNSFQAGLDWRRLSHDRVGQPHDRRRCDRHAGPDATRSSGVGAIGDVRTNDRVRTGRKREHWRVRSPGRDRRAHPTQRRVAARRRRVRPVGGRFAEVPQSRARPGGR